MKVTLMRSPFVRSDRHEQGECAYVVPLSTALTRTFSSDAHWAQYITPNGRRLSGESAEKLGGVELQVIAFDVDCEEVHGSPEPAPEWWRAQELAKLATLHGAHPGTFMYWTRGGYRIVYVQRKPTMIRTREDAQRWCQEYAIAVAYLARRFDIHADPACSDWTRLFRCPRATRELGGEPENWALVGNPNQVGELVIKAAHEDVETARAASKAFREARSLDFTPHMDDGQGLLYHLLRARGDIIRPHGDAYVIRCPREQHHTSGRTGNGSTLLYLPAHGHEVGAIHCLHAHCADLSVSYWLREFSFAERDAARAAAGLETRAA